jgi:hypothetical protein
MVSILCVWVKVTVTEPVLLLTLVATEPTDEGDYGEPDEGQAHARADGVIGDLGGAEDDAEYGGAEDEEPEGRAGRV